VSEEWFDRQQASFDRAQRQYPCHACDGTGKAIVAAVLDVDGNVRPRPRQGGLEPEVECPFCESTVRPVQHHEVWCGGDCECYKAGQEGRAC
jgi:hypothetical protein